jgi:3-oxoacyl-ACP reductase-like protein
LYINLFIERIIVMGLFSTILEKLGLKKDKKEEEAKPAAAAPAAAAKPAAPAAKPAAAKPAASVGAKAATIKRDDEDVPAKPAAISEVDVVAQLEAKAKGKDLNWKVSIVDLLKLLDIDSSREAREELAKELGCPEDQMSDSARMNVWLHKTVLKKIAENGGNIPADLLD